MAGSKFSLPPAKRAGSDVEARNRQLLAVEADVQAGRLSEAAALLNDLAKADPGDARVYVAGWLLANKAGNNEAALQSAQRAVNLAPMSATAHYCLGESHHIGGDIDAARDSVNRALMLAPTQLQFRELAVNLATMQGDHAGAELHLRAAHSHNAEIPGVKMMIGNALRLQSKFDEAETWLTEALAANADDADALHGLAMVAYLRDSRLDAQSYIERALALRPDDAGYQYLLAVFKGEAPAQRPEAMTRGLFDGYASRFDKHRVGPLSYRVSQTIATNILERYPHRTLNILDLGCGSGRLGAELGRIEGFLVGVDLSMPMLEEAKKHDVYSRLHNVNLLDALEATDANEYEVIVAGDVFIYLGALDAAIRNALKVLRPGGWLYATFETAPDDGHDFVVSKSIRYAHSRRYVKGLLAAAGYAEPLIEAIDLRTDQDVAVTGYLVSVQKPA